ncbi:hypothetical protein DFH27DRAFT_560933 [Peziza echinospora]|nr:hypothetical protein DFH27DRAFT_560933 [Peziza echinospora]
MRRASALAIQPLFPSLFFEISASAPPFLVVVAFIAQQLRWLTSEVECRSQAGRGFVVVLLPSIPAPRAGARRGVECVAPSWRAAVACYPLQ